MVSIAVISNFQQKKMKIKVNSMMTHQKHWYQPLNHNEPFNGYVKVLASLRGSPQLSLICFMATDSSLCWGTVWLVDVYFLTDYTAVDYYLTNFAKLLIEALDSCWPWWSPELMPWQNNPMADLGQCRLYDRAWEQLPSISTHSVEHNKTRK